MKKYLLLIVTLFSVTQSFSQLLSWTPQFPTANTDITITVDATQGNQGLLGYTGTVYLHLGLITNLSTSNTDWKHVTTTWGSTTSPGVAPIATSAGANKWQFTINPSTSPWFSALSNGETIKALAILFRKSDGSNAQKNTDGSDTYVPIYSAGNHIQITTPAVLPTNPVSNAPITNATAGQVINFAAVSSVSGNLSFTLNGNQFASTTNTTTINGNATSVAGSNQVIASLNGVAFDTVNYFVSIPTVIKALPVGAKEGINYYNCTDSVTLVLFAPNKTSSMLIGEFPGSNWTSQAQFQMNKTPDGNYYWITVHGLTSGTEYAYQYLVDNTIYVPDAYSQKILDPNDRYINPNTYPNLKPYPTHPNVSSGKNGLVSVLQICEPQYNWAVTNFTKPDKKNLIIYELLVRDFSRPNPPAGSYDSIGNYQTIIDSIGYFKKLGINAIEFMPLQEFNGNISWGYNPTFYFAPDKVYGTKNKLKELIDTLHKNGIAVLLDVVYNHLDAFVSPIGKLYWDATNNRPAANNPWLNPTAPHSSLSFFNDLNHNTAATQYLTKASLEHWITEYKIDGFRFDFTKGMTQTVSNSDNSAYDQNRIDILNRYYDYIVPKYPNTYMVLEHFCAASEENVLINKGFMTWREMFSQYKESLLGTGGNKNIGDVMWNYNGNGRAAPSPGLVGFMGSHDKERLMYEALQNGGNFAGYNVKNLSTALARMEALAAVFFTVPGPKMIWQFDEFGYDISRGGNTDRRAPHWEYLSNPDRVHLLEVNKKLIQFRLANPAVFNNIPTAYDLVSYYKYFQIGDPNIANTQVSIVANFGLSATTQTLTFQKTGGWYNFISNGTGAGVNGATNATFNLATTSQTITLQPGEYHVYVSVPPCTSANPTVTTPISYCQNSTAPALTATGSGLLWYTTPTNGTGVTTLTPSTSTAGNTTYYVTQTAGGCSESQRVALVVNITTAPVQPTASVTVQPTCDAPAGTIVVTAPTGASIRYSINGTDYTNTNGTFTGLINNTTYNVTAKDINTGCVSIARSLTVNPIPGAPAQPAVAVTPPTCTVATGTLTVSSAITGLTFSNDGVNYTNTTGVFSNIAAGSSYSITAKNSTGCISSPATGILAQQPPTPVSPTVNITQPSCTVATATISVTSDITGLTFSSDGVNYTNTTGVFTNVGAGTSYSITAKNTSGCISVARTGTINAQPNVPAQPTASVTVQPTCVAPTGTIVVTAPTGVNIRYSIDGINYTNTSGTFTGLTNNTTYSITAKDINSTCVSIARQVTVDPIPGAPAQPTVTPTQPTCTVATGTLTVSSSITGLTFSSDGINYTNTTGIFLNVAAGSSYNITAKNSNGCVSSPATGTLSAQPITPSAPTVDVLQPSCTSATATITVTSDKTGLTFSNDGINYTNTNGVFANIAANSSYSITAKTINGGCVSVARTGSVNAQPNVPAQPTASVTAAPTCILTSGTITVTAPTGGNIRYSIDGVNYTNTTGVFSSLTHNTTYNITAKDINSTCVSSVRSILVPAVPVIAMPQLNVQQPTCTVATATITVTSDKTGLAFSNDGINYTNTTGLFTNITASTSYSITAKDGGGCLSPAAEGNINAQPLIPGIPVGLNVTDITNSSAKLRWALLADAASYSVDYKLSTASNWTNVVSGITAIETTITGLTANTSYNWRVRGNCDANTGGEYAEAEFTTTNAANISNIKNGLGIAVLVNPVSASSKIAYVVPANATCSILLYTSNGQKIKVILSQSVTTGQHEISIGDLVQRLSKGTYFLKITQGNISNFTKFIKP